MSWSDEHTLLIVDPDLKREDLRIADVQVFRSLSREELLVETGEGKTSQFWIVDAATFSRREIAWKE